MKFALNHKWRFQSSNLAIFAGLTQVLTIVFVELILFSLVVLSHEILEVIVSFIALFAVSRLDEVFFSELS